MAANQALTEWLRGACADFVFHPVGVYLAEGDHAWPLHANDAAGLEAQLDEGGHLAPLPKESAALANIIEVALVDFLIERLRAVPDAEARRGEERAYPDLEISGSAFGGGYHAVDVKMARLHASGRRTQSRCTLYTGNTFFRWPQFAWPGVFRPFETYTSHLDVLGIYRLDVDYRGRVRDLELLVHEPWRIASRERSSTTREYIGAIVDIEKLHRGEGDFDSEEEFYRYWRSFPFRVPRAVERQLDRFLREQRASEPEGRP